MKGKKYTTEDKFRILREADAGKGILEVCREHNISEVSFQRWKRQFGQMEINEARRLKDLERENTELKKDAGRSALEEPGPGDGMRKKALGPAHRRTLAKQAVEPRMCSERAACRILRLVRSTYSYRGRVPSSAEMQMRRRLHAIEETLENLTFTPIPRPN